MLADTLAKAAAREAQSFGEETSIITIQDVKTHARYSVRIKLQDRWDIAETGNPPSFL